MIPNRQNKSKGDAKRGPNKDHNKPKTISDYNLFGFTYKIVTFVDH